MFSLLFSEQFTHEDTNPTIMQDYGCLIPEVQAKILGYLPEHWVLIFDVNGVNILLLSRDVERTTQRRLFVSFMGDISVSVHRKKLSVEMLHKICGTVRTVPLSESNVNDFASQVLGVVDNIRKFEICVGCNNEEFKSLWCNDAHGVVDVNSYGETRYSKTFRSLHCQLLVLTSKWRCMKCYYLNEILKRKSKSHRSGIKVHTPNIHLTEAEKIQKLTCLQKNVEMLRKYISRLKNCEKSRENERS